MRRRYVKLTLGGLSILLLMVLGACASETEPVAEDPFEETTVPTEEATVPETVPAGALTEEQPSGQN